MGDQEAVDTFYWKHGPCCAGCDWWSDVRAGVIGECIKAAPIAGIDRAAMLGMAGVSAPVSAGHPLTKRDYYCGDFKDDFDWSSLPVAYRARIGAPTGRFGHPS